MTKRLRRPAPRLSAASPFPPGTGRPVRTGHAYLAAFLSAALLLLALYAAPASASPEENGFGEENVRAYDNGATAVQALLGGQIDAVIIDDAPARQYVAANDSLTILDTPWVEEEYCAAVDEGNTALLHAINTALNELMDDGTVQSIQDKYISAD